MNQENKNFHENRYLNNKKKKIKRIKIGVIIAIIIGTVIVTCEACIEIHNNWTTIKDLENYLDYRDGKIDYDEYNDRSYELTHDHYLFEFAFLIVSNSARVGLNIVFIAITISFLSITIDDSFSKKMRRISLILASITLLFIMYSIFIPNLILLV